MSGANVGFQNSDNAATSNTITEDPNSSTDVKPVSIFSNDYKKHDDLKQMLDSNKDNLKLDAMKRIVGMIAKGKNASDLFPAVVKNVVSKNVEIKKLVYVYLMRYAEEQQDLALLSISTFQRALKDPNQLIRASALRVLSSIRVPIITTIMMLAIKEAVTDMSPYVRKTAANAIIKLYSLDSELKDDLIGIIEKLLADKTILVAGSAIQAFEAVCPERIDLIHKNYRKLCNLLIDVDEWGQVVIINMLTRYARTQFVNPGTIAEPLVDKNSEQVEQEEEDEDDDYDNKFAPRTNKSMDQDHRLLLRVSKPLLQSRNSSVVLAVAQLYYYVAPSNETQAIAKSLVRLLRSHREVQIIVLKNIVSIAQNNKDMFQAYQKNFYIHSEDNIHIKLLKLEILTCLANQNNISVILRELQTYVLSNDKEFAAASINAIGRCASTIKEVTDSCLTGLVNLMSKRDENVVAESVVVVKRLLQSNPSKNGPIIKKMTKMIDKVSIPSARASILWLIGEYSDRVSKLAPDVLRKMAKSFCDEESVVKLQIINLAVKLYLTNQKQVALLVQYVLNLAKYDQNYDIRDRARFLRTLILNNENCPNLAKHLKKILLASKPAPVLQSIYKDSDQYQLGTLSHMINMRVNGYVELPSFPSEAPDPTVRNIELPAEKKVEKAVKSKQAKSEKFYSDEEEEEQKSQSTEGADPTDEEEEENEDEEEEEEEESEEESEEEAEDEEEKFDSEKESKAKVNASNKAKAAKKIEASSSESEESESESETETEEEKDKESKSTTSKQIQNKPQPNVKSAPVAKPVVVLSSSSSSEESSNEETDSETSQSEEENKKKKPIATKKVEPKKEAAKPSQPSKEIKTTTNKSKTQPEVSLLDLDFSEPMVQSNSLVAPTSLLSPSLAAELANLSTNSSATGFNQQTIVSNKQYELLNKINGNGLQVNYKFTRTLNQQSNKMINVELTFVNFSNGDFCAMNISNKKLQSGMVMSDLNEFDLLKNATQTRTIGIDFNDTTQPAQFELSAVYSNDPLLGGSSNTRKWSNLSITCPIGELIQPGWSISENEFNKLQAKLKGMNEINAVVDDFSQSLFVSRNIGKVLLESMNICQIPSSQQETYKYAALTASSKAQLLLSLYFPVNSNKCHINVNCEKIVLSNMFIKEVKQILCTNQS